MESVNYLLTDKYQDFAEKIRNLHNMKKHLKKELSGSGYNYNNLLKQIHEIDKEAGFAVMAWEKWKEQYLVNSSDG